MTARSFPRVLGTLTLAYGAYTLVRPSSLVRAAGLESLADPRTRSGQALGRVVGSRDLLSGLAMTAAPPGAPLRAAIVARVGCDISDVVGFGLAVEPRSRVKVVTVAAFWGLLCASSLAAARRER